MIEHKAPQTQDIFTDPYVSQHNDPLIFKPPELAGWTCYLFGGSPQSDFCITWRPDKKSLPNWFWRKMQYLLFGNMWIKDK